MSYGPRCTSRELIKPSKAGRAVNQIKKLAGGGFRQRCGYSRRLNVLKGFKYHLTPKGKSTLNPTPPWYYSADFLNIEFWRDPVAFAARLPGGLDPEPSADGHASALFYDWQFSGSNEELLDPARYQYREFFVLVDALFEGRPVSHCPYIFVENDAALARGGFKAIRNDSGQFPNKILRRDR
jgi:acetoacetate decarboxylase